MADLTSRATKKLVIIGAGIAGMTAGIYALRQGFVVEIFEKHTVAGGECTGWDRNGFHIDNCIHWLMGTAPGSDLNRIWRAVGALDDNTRFVPLEVMYSSELDGQRITLWKDLERTRAELLALSPADAPQIESLIRDCRDAADCGIPAEVAPELMGPGGLLHLLRSTGSSLRLMKRYKGMDVADLQARFTHPLIRCMLSDFCTPEMPAYSFPMAYGNFCCGDGGLPQGGSRGFAQRIRDTFIALGGRLHLGQSADSFTIVNGRVTHLVLADGEQVAGDWFVPACDPDFVFHHMLDESYMDEVFHDIYHNRAAYPVYSMFQAAFAVDSPLDALGGDLTLEIPELPENDLMSDRMTVKLYPYEPNFAPEVKQVLTVLYGGKEGWYDVWQALYKEDRSAYNRQKQVYSAVMQRRLEQRFPAYAGKLSLLDSWTPMTYRRYCNAFKGYNQAYAITKQSRPNPYPSPYLRGLDNVVLAGQWLSAPGGLPGAAITGKYAVQRICKKEKLPFRF